MKKQTHQWEDTNNSHMKKQTQLCEETNNSHMKKQTQVGRKKTAKRNEYKA